MVAAAGVHLLSVVDLGTGDGRRPRRHHGRGAAGRPALDAWLAQPSGLAARRRPALDRRRRDVRAALAGTRPGRRPDAHRGRARACSTSATCDGPAAEARFQHPLGVTALPDGGVCRADTYNGAVRRYDPTPDTVSTLATGLAEPTAAVLLDGGDAGGGRVRRAPADPADRARRDAARSPAPARPHRAGRPPTIGARRAHPRRRLHAGARAEARRPLRSVHPAAGQRLPAGAAA